MGESREITPVDNVAELHAPMVQEGSNMCVCGRRVTDQQVHTEQQHTWMCGAFQPSDGDGTMPYRCTLSFGHGSSRHRAYVEGELCAVWEAS